jgi:hypothetical protein
MMRKEGLEMAVNSNGDAGATRRPLHPLVLLCLPSIAAANGPQQLRPGADPARRDAPISVWWDYPPGGGSR